MCVSKHSGMSEAMFVSMHTGVSVVSKFVSKHSDVSEAMFVLKHTGVSVVAMFVSKHVICQRLCLFSAK